MVQAVPRDVLEKSSLPTIPIGRLGRAEEIGCCVAFLAYDDAGLITGYTVTADGGQVTRTNVDESVSSGTQAPRS
jgi:acetoacetyl-CoA reductase